MKISEIISQFEKAKKEFGDIELKAEQTDGRSTWLASISYVEIKKDYTPWKGHSQRGDVLKIGGLY